MKKLMKLVKNENGATLVFVALLMVVLMGFVALVVDIGNVALTKAKLQSAADAAALAGAKDLPNASTAVSTAITFAGQNGLKATVNGIKELGDTVTVTTPYDGKATRVEVVCTRTVSYTFAKILGFTSADVSARAVAVKKGINGETLPFINFDPYDINNEIEIWDNEGKGNKERLNTDTLMYQFDPEVGAVHGNGKIANLKQELGAVLTDGATVYLLSLSNDVMKSNTTIPTTKKNGDPGSFVWPGGNVGQETIIDSQYLVLLKCTVRYYNNKTVTLEIDEVYKDLKSLGIQNKGNSVNLIE